MDQHATSGDKFFAVLSMCDRLGVHTTPKFVGELIIWPLFSWYKGGDQGLGSGDPGVMRHFDPQCTWPEFICDTPNNSLSSSIATFFEQLNKLAIDTLRRKPSTVATISFSHFVPHTQLFPGLAAMRHVMGCESIARQVALCDSDVHVFGHSHLNIDLMLDGTRFVQAALGHQRDLTRDPYHQPSLVWDSNAKGTLLLDMQRQMEKCDVSTPKQQRERTNSKDSRCSRDSRDLRGSTES